MNGDNYYWLFSSAAQSIAALIAFLMAGIALAFSMMDRLVERDPTYQEIIESLRQKQHKQLAGLAIITGISILTSLLAVYLNPCQTVFRTIVRYIAVIVDIFVVISSIVFVISITKPSRYKRMAEQEYDKSKPRPSQEPQEPSNVFFREFIILEQNIRDYIRQQDLGIPGPDVPRTSLSFGQMVNILYQNERISSELKARFLKVNKFRNLLFHGGIDKVDEGVIEELREAKSAWDREKQNNPT
jgi:hypothetical protein